MTAQRKIQVVSHTAMMNDALYSAMHKAPKSKVAAMMEQINKVCDDRETFEATVERTLANGEKVQGQSADIKHVQALKDHDAVARMFIALRIDPVSYIFPQSKEGGKSSSETSNLKAYRKARQVAEVIYNGSSKLENVCKVFAVCAYRATVTFGQEVLKREYAENFMTRAEFRSIAQGTEDLWSAIDDIRAKHMSTGAQTQASQMIRTLVALGSAVDVMDGRSKNVAIRPDGLVINALMQRLGQKEVVEDAA